MGDEERERMTGPDDEVGGSGRAGSDAAAAAGFLRNEIDLMALGRVRLSSKAMPRVVAKFHSGRSAAVVLWSRRRSGKGCGWRKLRWGQCEEDPTLPAMKRNRKGGLKKIAVSGLRQETKKRHGA